MKGWYLKDDYDVSSWRFGTSKSITKSTSSDKTYASLAIASLMMWFLIWAADSWRLILKPNAPNCGKTQQITEKIWNPATTCTMLVLWIQEAQNRKMRLPPEGPDFLAAAAEKGGLLWRQTKTDHFTSLLLSSATPQGKFRTWKKERSCFNTGFFFYTRTCMFRLNPQHILGKVCHSSTSHMK